MCCYLRSVVIPDVIIPEGFCVAANGEKFWARNQRRYKRYVVIPDVVIPDVVIPDVVISEVYCSKLYRQQYCVPCLVCNRVPGGLHRVFAYCTAISIVCRHAPLARGCECARVQYSLAMSMISS